MRLEARPAPNWPPLAWLAWCPKDGSRVLVIHGSRVEAGDGFLCEAVWPGEYERGDFDRAAVTAGSGIRARGGQVAFVSSASTVDRLHSHDGPDGSFVSNSLPCLLSALGARLVPAYARYQRDILSIGRGIDHYRRFIPTSAGRVRLTYFRDLVWDGPALATRDKPQEELDLSSFQGYRDHLRETFEALAENMRDARRRHPLSMLGTLSSGYDAATVTALAAEAGCEEALCFAVTGTGEPDSGEPFAKALGVRPLLIPNEAWRAMGADSQGSPPEAPFFAGSPKRALIPYRGAEAHLAGRVLMTGFYGDSVWGLETEDVAPDMRRLTPSGLTFTEYRLRAGFIHCAPAFWTGRRLADVVALSRSEEMRPWVIGKSYQRPIARRIVEEAGVPRGAFGIHKRAGVGTAMFEAREFLTRASMADYMGWIRDHRRTLGDRRVPLLASPAVDRAMWSGIWLLRTAVREAKRVPRVGKSRLRKRLDHGVRSLYRRPSYLRAYVFLWAMDRSRDAYPMGADLRDALRESSPRAVGEPGPVSSPAL